MSKENRIRIKDFISSDMAIVAEEGKIINAEICKYISEKESVIVDFDKIELVNTAFLNTAIGELYKDYSSEDLSKYLTIILDKSDIESLKLVIERAKNFYKNRDSFNSSVENAFENE